MRARAHALKDHTAVVAWCEAFTLSVALTQRRSAMAVDTLAKVMNDPASHNTARVTAATSLLRYGRESIGLDDLAARVDQLEAEHQEEKL